MASNSRTTPNNDVNKLENSRGGTDKNSPPSGKGSPPKAGAHTAKFINHGGDHGRDQSAGIHPSLKKPDLMR